MFIFGKISFVLLVFSPAGIAEIVNKPTVTEVVVGGSTFLNCSTNDQLKINWFLTKVGANAANYIYLNDTFRTGIGRFQMERDGTNRAYNLVIQSVKMEDAGLYGCEEEGGQRSKHEAQLIVLDPVCEPHYDTHEIIGLNNCGIEPNQLIISCIVDYNGNDAPIMEWRKVSDNTSVSEGVTNASIDNKRVVYNLTIKGNNSSVKDGESYLCIATRSSTEKYGCKSGKIIVKGTDSSSADQLCRPYHVIICILLILLPTANFVQWYLCVYRPKRRPTENSKQRQLPRHREPEQIGLTDTEGKETIEKLTAENERLSAKVNELEQQVYSPGQAKNLDQEKSPARKRTEQIELIDKQDNETIEKMTAENRKLLAKVKELEQKMYSADNKTRKTSATLAHTIVTKAVEKTNGVTPITGMAILDSNLFVVKKNYQDVEVYDSETFVYVRVIDILGFTNPLDIASTKENDFLYVIDRRNGESESIIRKFNTAGEGGKAWLTENDNGRLSTYESNLIVCFCTKRIIIEYTPESDAANVVRLSPGNGFNKLWHAVKLTGTHFVVSHSMVEDGQRVCVVDISGSVLSVFEKLPASLLNILSRDHLPICLVGQRDESVLVADARNKRILLLSPKELEYEAELIETGKTQMPVRLCLNEAKNRLFVGVDSSIHTISNEGLILIYNLSK